MKNSLTNGDQYYTIKTERKEILYKRKGIIYKNHLKYKIC